MEIIRNSRGVHGSSCEGSSEEEEGGGGAMRRADYTGIPHELAFKNVCPCE